MTRRKPLPYRHKNISKFIISTIKLTLIRTKTIVLRVFELLNLLYESILVTGFYKINFTSFYWNLESAQIDEFHSTLSEKGKRPEFFI